MLSNRLAVVVIGSACVLAAGSGAYLASRQNSAPLPQTSTAAGEAPQAVQETEAVMEPQAAGPVPDTPSQPTAERNQLSPEPPVSNPAPAARRPARTASARQVAPRPPSPRSPSGSREEPVRARPDARPSAPPAPDTIEDFESPPAVESTVERTETPPPPAPKFEELIVPADSVVGLQIENTISSEHAQIEDRVEARVTRDVTVGGRVAVPAGARALGSVSLVERGGKIKERARLGVRFHTLVLADGSTLPLQTETVFREGEAPANSSAAKIGGGAIGGAIIGAILGGGKGAVIGGSAGAAGGTAATMAGKRKAATLPSGSTVTVRVLSPVTVTVER